MFGYDPSMLSQPSFPPSDPDVGYFHIEGERGWVYHANPAGDTSWMEVPVSDTGFLSWAVSQQADSLSGLERLSAGLATAIQRYLLGWRVTAKFDLMKMGFDVHATTLRTTVDQFIPEEVFRDATDSKENFKDFLNDLGKAFRGNREAKLTGDGWTEATTLSSQSIHLVDPLQFPDWAAQRARVLEREEREAIKSILDAHPD
jgi:hypothetical protein